MPILQGGTFYASLSGAGSTTIQPVSFTYYPIGPIGAVVFLAGFLFLVKQGRILKGPYSMKVKLTAASPLALAFTLALSTSDAYAIAFAAALLGQFLTLLNWSRPNQSASHGYRAWMMCSLATAVLGVTSASDISSIGNIIIGSLITGAIYAIPLTVMRGKTQNGFTWKNALTGAAFGVSIPSSFFIYFALIAIRRDAPVSVLRAPLFSILYLAASALLFCFLLVKNPWAQNAAITPIIKPSSKPTTSIQSTD